MSRSSSSAKSKGRLELLQWINSFLQADYAKLEDLRDCVAYCQVLDALHPGKLPLHRLSFAASGDRERLQNAAVLADATKRLREQLPVAAQRLPRGAFQDHLECVHWAYERVQAVFPDAEISYPAMERRRQASEPPAPSRPPDRA